MDIRHASEWATERPVTGPPLDWSLVTHFVVHYPGADIAGFDFDRDGDVDTADTAELARRAHRMYLDDPARGYSLGYNWYVGHLGIDGDVWDVRGSTIRNAANKGRDGSWNPRSVSACVIVDDQDPANLRQIEAVRSLLEFSEAKAGRTLAVIVHGDIDATPCAGAGITAQLRAGLFRRPAPPTTTPPAPPAATPPKGPPDMPKLIRFRGYQSVFLIGAGPALHLTVDLAKSYEAAGLAIEVVDAHPLGMTSVCHQAGIAKINLPVQAGE